MSASKITIRPATPDDAEALLSIYAPYVEQTAITFEYEVPSVEEGKVREIYDNGDSLIMVATDRISCFDVILNNVVTKKAAVTESVNQK